jgi:hypothetical protein
MAFSTAGAFDVARHLQGSMAAGITKPGQLRLFHTSPPSLALGLWLSTLDPSQRLDKIVSVFTDHLFLFYPLEFPQGMTPRDMKRVLKECK